MVSTTKTPYPPSAQHRNGRTDPASVDDQLPVEESLTGDALAPGLTDLYSSDPLAWLDTMGIDWFSVGKILLQMALLTGILYFVYSRLIHRNHAEQILKGLFVILLTFIALWGFSRLVGFTMLEVVFGASIQLLIIGLIVIFQPELRRLLLYLGQAGWFHGSGGVLTSEEKKAEYLVREITESVRYMSKSKTGALMVLESTNAPTGAYLEAGTPLDAKLSTELLLTIFHTNAPLHDGAVLLNVESNRIIAAGTLLPLTEDPSLSWRYGTRHRAAIGLTEVSDARCIVVSEETGSISFVEAGVLEKLDTADDLKKKLERTFHVTGGGSKKRRYRMGDAMSGWYPQTEAWVKKLWHWITPAPSPADEPKSKDTAKATRERDGKEQDDRLDDTLKKKVLSNEGLNNRPSFNGRESKESDGYGNGSNPTDSWIDEEQQRPTSPSSSSRSQSSL